MLAMADLRALAEGLKFTDVRTLLQSGNLLFESKGQTSAKLEQVLENATKSQLGLAIDFVVRSDKEIRQAIASIPFPNMAEEDPSHLVCMFLKRAVTSTDVETLRAKIIGPELVQAVGKQLYIVYPAGIGRSKLTNVLIEKALGIRGTARNWNTVRKIAAILDG
jgi:uncharacterized protein (DUF1697 family)